MIEFLRSDPNFDELIALVILMEKQGKGLPCYPNIRRQAFTGPELSGMLLNSMRML